jgi:hypothetical protein
MTTDLGIAGALSSSSSSRSASSATSPLGGVYGRTFAASQRIGPLDRLGVRIDEQLVRVEAVALVGRVGAVDAEAVALPGPDAGQVAVPLQDGALGERDALLVVVVVEQAQLDALAVLAEDREVRAVPSHVAPSGNGLPGQTSRLIGRARRQRRQDDEAVLQARAVVRGQDEVVAVDGDAALLAGEVHGELVVAARTHSQPSASSNAGSPSTRRACRAAR